MAVLCHPGWLETQSKLSWDWVRGVNFPLGSGQVLSLGEQSSVLLAPQEPRAGA